MKSYEEFENSIITKLKDSNLISRFSTTEFKQSPNLPLIMKMFEQPSILDIDDGGLFFIDESGDKIYCPEMFVTISERGEWISDMIPNVEFDIDQSGNVRKADEAEALFCTTVISIILKENVFKDEVHEIVKDYDFKGMKPNKDGDKTFRQLLNEWQDLQSVIINILISACKYRISDYKKDTEKFLKDGIPSIEAAELRDLESKIRAINFEYSEGILSPIEIKKKNKIERLRIIDERDTKISSLVMNSSVGILYKILKLSSEYISPIKKKKILLWVNKEVDKLLQMDGYQFLKEDRPQLVSRLSRRAIKFEKISMRKIFVEKYIQDRENFKLPSKL